MRAGSIRRHVLLALAAAGAAACSNASSDTGVNALLRVSGTGVQYVPGTLGTEAAADTPTMQGINIANTIVYPGAIDRTLTGSAIGSTAVLIGLDGDIGHWIAPTGLPDSEFPGGNVFDFSTRFSVSPFLPLDPPDRMIIFRAVDAQGQVGPSLSQPIKIKVLANPLGISLDGQPLVITLVWDSPSNLDLKVRVPNTTNPASPIDVWTKHRVALPTLGPADPPYMDSDVMGVGQLDFDTNANCVIGGIQQDNQQDSLYQEDVVFQTAPPSPKAAPSGTYEVRVDAASLCGQVTARWHVYAVANGSTLLGEAYGQATDIDTQGSHGPATGTLAFTFMVP
ncbi:MAG TPA: hypothetical protein VKQ32_15650 [Polyangia bacterium]|nr:hypothetical protein [Polyangia bacterium]